MVSWCKLNYHFNINAHTLQLLINKSVADESLILSSLPRNIPFRVSASALNIYVDIFFASELTIILINHIRTIELNESFPLTYPQTAPFFFPHWVDR